MCLEMRIGILTSENDEIVESSKDGGFMTDSVSKKITWSLNRVAADLLGCDALLATPKGMFSTEKWAVQDIVFFLKQSCENFTIMIYSR